MADMKRIKGRIAETIYPNGTGAITAESHQALLLEMVDDINAKKADQSELVATQESLEALTDTVNNLPQGGGDVKADGVYPDLTAGDLAGRGESVPAEFGFRASGGKSIKDGRAYIKAIKGNSVVWNQKVKGFVSWNLQGGTIEGNEAVWSAESRTGVLNAHSNTFAQHTTHKYLISADVKASSTNVGLGIYFTNSPIVKHTGSGNYESLAIITNGKGDGVDACYLTDVDTSGYSEIRAKNYRCIDLTHMFGAGNEPTTIEEFNARVATLGVDMYAYNEGEVIHCNTESIKSVGDNAWDEQWEIGAIDPGTGESFDADNNIRSKDYNRIIGGQEYSFLSAQTGTLILYDEHYNYVDYWNIAEGQLRVLTIADNAAYFKICLYDYTYKNGTMLRLNHSGWKSETGVGYEPYWQDILPLPIIRKYFPQGMKSAGSAHDEIRYNKASGKWEKVEAIGIRAYQEGDADNAAYLTDGKVTCYPLAEPIVTELEEADQNFRDYYNVADFGTEMSQSNNVPSAAFSADIIYQFNAVDMIREHELEITELQNVIATMQTQLKSLINGGQ